MNATSILSSLVAENVNRLSIQHRTFACDPEFADTTGLCEKYGFVPTQITNTMLVAGKADPTRYAACVVLSTYKVNVNKVVRELLDVKRATFATAQETAAVTGMTVGGVGPFGLPMSLPIYVDASVLQESEVLSGGGNLAGKLLFAPSELCKLSNVKIIEALGIPRSA